MSIGTYCKSVSMLSIHVTCCFFVSCCPTAPAVVWYTGRIPQGLTNLEQRCHHCDLVARMCAPLVWYNMKMHEKIMKCLCCHWCRTSGGGGSVVSHRLVLYFSVELTSFNMRVFISLHAGNYFILILCMNVL